MCIRDSNNIGRIFQAFEHLEVGAVLANEIPTFRADHMPYGCLLYTSDAADERSSVDLGGRRIIKKKNNSI